MSRMISKMNLISVVQQLPKKDRETIQGYVEMIEEENQELELELSGYRQAILNNKEMLGLKEKNQELKKQLENKYKKVGTLTGELLYEENTKLIKENKELKKQLDEYKGSHYCSFIDICKSTKIANYNQQKEFLDYLENEIKRITALDETKVSQGSIMTMRCMKSDYEEILQKYKSIIGDINDKK